MNLKKMERYLRVNLLGPGPRLLKKEFTGPRSHKGWETLSGPKHTSVFCLILPILYLYALSDPCGAPTKIPWVRPSLCLWQVGSRSMNYTLKCTFIHNVNMCSCCWLLEFYRLISQHYRSQLLRSLRRGSADARLLGLRVRIPPGACVSMY